MDFVEAKNEIEKIRSELWQTEEEHKYYYKEYRECERKIRLCESVKRDMLKRIKELEDIIEERYKFESVKCLEGYDSLLEEELVAISNGMDKTDYRKPGTNGPRWIDLERLVEEVIEFKKKNPGWILECVTKGIQYDNIETFIFGFHEPKTFYKFTYKTPQGDIMSYVGKELLSS